MTASRHPITAPNVELNPRPISDPYPVPQVGTVSLEKAHDELLGIKVKSHADENAVYVSGMVAGSMIARTSMKVGDEILAVNGQAVSTAKQVIEMISDSSRVEFTTFDSTCNKAPFCYVEVAPTSKINPGVSFAGCCNRSMVMIGDIFVADLTKTRLRKGDIVLAVNGVPVWKPEDADREQLRAARDSKSVVLYCVDMEALRAFFAKHVPRRHALGTDVRTTGVSILDASTVIIAERDCRFVAKVNLESQLFEDETQGQYRLKTFGSDYTSKYLHVKNSYATCHKTFEALNDLMQRQLLVLKAKIVANAWNASLKRDDSIPTYMVPSAPLAPMEIGSPDHAALRHSMIPTAQAIPIETAFSM